MVLKFLEAISQICNHSLSVKEINVLYTAIQWCSVVSCMCQKTMQMYM